MSPISMKMEGLLGALEALDEIETELTFLTFGGEHLRGVVRALLYSAKCDRKCSLRGFPFGDQTAAYRSEWRWKVHRAHRIVLFLHRLREAS